MARTIIDLGVPIEDVPGQGQAVEVTHHLHEEGAASMKSVFNCGDDDLPQGKGWATDTLTLNTHSGTHVDAPWHYTPVSEGKKARTIDELPLEWFYGDGVVLDMRHKPWGSAVTVADLKETLDNINYHLKPGDIVMIQTGTDKHWGREDYNQLGCGMTRESTLWLIEQGIRVMGIDTWGWDRPFPAIRDEFKKNKDSSIIWGGHFAGIEKEYCHIEKLANLEKLPKPFGFKVACFPIKVTGGSAGWSRVVAILEE